MKTIYLFIVILSLGLTACQDEPVVPTTTTNLSSFNPPAWVIGSWTDSIIPNYSTYEFKVGDVIHTAVGSSTSYKSIGMKIDEQISNDTMYYFKVTSGATSTSYYFIKNTPITLKHSISSVAGTVRVFIKQ